MIAQLINGFEVFSTPDPDMDKTFEQLCNQAGYRVEAYTVQTEDGYLLGLYRIPGTLNEAPEDELMPELSSKPPILF